MKFLDDVLEIKKGNLDHVIRSFANSIDIFNGYNFVGKARVIENYLGIYQIWIGKETLGTVQWDPVTLDKGRVLVDGIPDNYFNLIDLTERILANTIGQERLEAWQKKRGKREQQWLLDENLGEMITKDSLSHWIDDFCSTNNCWSPLPYQTLSSIGFVIFCKNEPNYGNLYGYLGQVIFYKPLRNLKVSLNKFESSLSINKYQAESSEELFRPKALIENLAYYLLLNFKSREYADEYRNKLDETHTDLGNVAVDTDKVIEKNIAQRNVETTPPVENATPSANLDELRIMPDKDRELMIECVRWAGRLKNPQVQNMPEFLGSIESTYGFIGIDKFKRLLQKAGRLGLIRKQKDDWVPNCDVRELIKRRNSH